MPALDDFERFQVEGRFPNRIAIHVAALRTLFAKGLPVRNADAITALEPARALYQWMADESKRLQGGYPSGEVPSELLPILVIDRLILGDGRQSPLLPSYFRSVAGSKPFSCPRARPQLPVELLPTFTKRLCEFGWPSDAGNPQNRSPWWIGAQTEPMTICMCARLGTAPSESCVAAANSDLVPLPKGKLNNEDAEGEPAEATADTDVTLSPALVRTKAAYEWAISAIPEADKLTIEELFSAIQAHPDMKSDFLDKLPDNHNTFATYLRRAGIHRYNSKGSRTRRLSRRPSKE